MASQTAAGPTGPTGPTSSTGLTPDQPWRWRAGKAKREQGELVLHLETWEHGGAWFAHTHAQLCGEHYRDARVAQEGLKTEKAARAWAEAAVARVLAALEEPGGG